MTPAEIYAIQVGLRAITACGRCGELKLVAEFAGYGARVCATCHIADHTEAASDDLERYWSNLKARVGVSAA